MLTDAAPAAIGRYKLERVLGRGAMGVVYKAHDPDIDRPVALKLVRADLLSGAERADYVQRFRQEARAAGRCLHANIVALHDFGVFEENPYLVMEYVDGVSLAQTIAGGTRFTPAEAVFLVRQVLEALDCAHGMGLVHRDIKPANVLLLCDGRVKVTDFGISRLAGSDLTQDGAVLGTPSYMAPEQCLGEEVDARSDLFSVGCMLHEMLTGQRPFPGRSVAEVTRRVIQEPAPDPGPHVPPPLRAALARALAKRPEARFPSARAMEEALRGGGPAPEQTVVVVRHALERPGTGSAPGNATGQFDPGPFDPALLSGIERRLAEHLGPIARRVVRQAVPKADSLDTLLRLLAESIPAPEARSRFLQTARQTQAGIATQHPATGGLGPEEIERVTADLARHLGPIARLLARREAPRARSAQDLRERLAPHITDEATRAAFLRGQRA